MKKRLFFKPDLSTFRTRFVLLILVLFMGIQNKCIALTATVNATMTANTPASSTAYVTSILNILYSKTNGNFRFGNPLPATQEDRSFNVFNLATAGIPAGSIINSVTLRVNIITAQNILGQSTITVRGNIADYSNSGVNAALFNNLGSGTTLITPGTWGTATGNLTRTFTAGGVALIAANLANKITISYTATASLVGGSYVINGHGNSAVPTATQPQLTIDYTLPCTPPVIALGTVTSPSTCTPANNGSIVITGLASSAAYTLNYTRNAIAQGPLAVSSTAGGTYTITGLTAATYAGINFSAGCVSNTLGPVVLTNPANPIITSVNTNNPTTCGGNNGALVINGTALSGNYTVTYTSSISGTVTTPAIASAANTVTVSGLPAATYTNVRITSSSTACASNILAGPYVLSNPALPSLTALGSANPTTCTGNDGTITATAVSLSGSYTVTYTSSVSGTVTTGAIAAIGNTVTVPSLAAATYTNIRITSTTTLCASNILPGPVVLTDPAPPVIVGVTPFGPTTCSGTDGAITVTGLLANTAYTLYYNNIPQAVVTDALGNYTIGNLSSGTYNNIYVVRFNCTSNTIALTTLLDPTPPLISGTSFLGTTTCGGTNGSFTIQGLLPNTAYGFFYNNAVTAQNIVTDAAGNYTQSNLAANTYVNIYVVRSNCTSNVVGPLTVSDPVPPVITSTSSAGPTTCFGSNGFINLQGLLPNTGYAVSYDDGITTFTPALVSDGAGDILIANLPAGTYNNFNVTINNCTSANIGPITISDPASPVVTASTNAPICEGQTLNLLSVVTLNGNPAVPNSYTWTGHGFVNPVNQANPTIPNAPAAATGVYTVTATIANCVSAPFTVPVTVYAAPSAPAFSVNTPLCSGNDLLLDVLGADPNLIYIWTGPAFATPDTNTNSVVSNAQTINAGIYSINVVNPFGCGLLNPSSVNVIINQTPAAPIPTNVVYCQEDVPVALIATPSGNPADTLKWYTVPTGGNATIAAPIPSTAAAGTFIWYVTQTSQPGCEGSRAAQNVWIKPKPTAPTSTTPDLTYCQFDNPVALAAAGDSLQWYTVATGGTPSSIVPVPSTAVAGTFRWYVTQTDDGCESNRLPITVTVIDNPDAPLTENVNYCQYDSPVALTAAGQNLIWYDVPEGGVALSAAPVPSTTQPGTTTWYVSQTVQGCESDRAALTVTIFYKPTAGIISSRNEVCQGDTLLFTYAGNGSQTTTYNWVWPIGSTIVNGTGQGPYVVRFSNIGTFDVTLVATENGCSSPMASHTITVKQTPDLSISLRDHIVCTDEPAYLAITSLNMEVNDYLWNFDGAHTSTGSTVELGNGPYYLNWDQPGMHIVSLDVTAKNQCSNSASDTVVVHERPNVRIVAPAGINDVCTGEDIELSVTDNNYKNTYRWAPRQMFNDEENNAVVHVHADRSQHITLEITNEYGCTSMDSVMLITRSCCEIMLPSAFSPNGDSKNDQFRIINPGRHRLESLKVYNRYGQMVYATSNEKDGWNGSYNGVAQEMGVYQYLVKYQCEGKDTYMKGEVTLVR